MGGFKYVYNNSKFKKNAWKIYIGIPALYIFLILFSFTNLKLLSFIYLSIMVFLLLPINLSKKNRMYKVMFLVICYVFKSKEYCYYK